MTTAVVYGSTDNQPSRALTTPSAFLLFGENPDLGIFESANGACDYVKGVGATSGQDIAIGAAWPGQLLETVWVYNGSASAISAMTISDGGTVMVPDAIAVPALPGAGAYWVFSFPGGPVRSQIGGWRLNITCAGTMNLIKWQAKGRWKK